MSPSSADDLRYCRENPTYDSCEFGVARDASIDWEEKARLEEKSEGRNRGHQYINGGEAPVATGWALEQCICDVAPDTGRPVVGPHAMRAVGTREVAREGVGPQKAPQYAGYGPFVAKSLLEMGITVGELAGRR